MHLKFTTFSSSLLAILTSLCSTNAVPLTNNSSFKEDYSISVQFTPGNISSNKVYWNVRSSSKRLEVYSPVNPLNNLYRLDGIKRDLTQAFCSGFSGLKLNVSEIEAEIIDLMLGCVPGIIKLSHEFNEVIVDTDNYSYVASVVVYTSEATNQNIPGLLFVAKKQVRLDEMKTKRIFETISKLNFSLKPLAVINKWDCKNFGKLGNDDDSIEADDSEEVQLNTQASLNISKNTYDIGIKLREIK